MHRVPCRVVGRLSGLQRSLIEAKTHTLSHHSSLFVVSRGRDIGRQKAVAVLTIVEGGSLCVTGFRDIPTVLSVRMACNKSDGELL